MARLWRAATVPLGEFAADSVALVMGCILQRERSDQTGR